jgi:FAD/FMN-containing dehydrogenase
MIRIAGSPQAVVSQAAHALALVRKEKPEFATLTDDDENLWRALAATPLSSTGKVIWRAAMWPTNLPDFLDEIVQLERDDASHPSVMWHAGIGDGRVRAIAQPAVYHREAVRVVDRLRQKAISLGGSLMIESAPPEFKAELDSWGDVGTSAELMRRVKQQLDPHALLSPGRFAAGI